MIMTLIKSWLRLKNTFEFAEDSVKACFPIYRVLVKKEYRNMKFDAVPKYKRIETYLDFDHATLDEVIATTSDWDYTLEGKYSNYNSYCYSKSKDNSLLSFVNSIKPDKLYFLFGQSDFLLVEIRRTLPCTICRSYVEEMRFTRTYK